MSKILPFDSAIKNGFLFDPQNDQNTISNRFWQLSFVTNGRTDIQLYYTKGDLDTARFRACIGCKNMWIHVLTACTSRRTCNSKPVLPSHIMVCAGVHLVTVWSQFMIFFIYNIFAEQTSHLCLYKLD